MSSFITALWIFCLLLFGISTATSSADTLLMPTNTNFNICNQVFLYDGRYDFSSFLFQGGFDGEASDWPRIFANSRPFTIDQDTKEEKISEVSKGTGRVIVIPPYVLTLNHVIDVKIIKTFIITPTGPQRIEKRADGAKEEEYWLLREENGLRIPLKKVMLLEENDLALFEMPSDYSISNSLALGKSGELEVGHWLFILGSPGLFGSFVREGIVSSTHVKFPSSVIQQLHIGEWLTESLIAFSRPAEPGDSGSIVVALRDGKPEIVGIVNIGWDSLGTMVAIDRVIEKIRETTGIDLRQQKENNLLRAKK